MPIILLNTKYLTGANVVKISFQLFVTHKLSFFNLFICAQNHGSQVAGVLGVNPPTVEEHLHSANDDVLIDSPE